MIVQLATGIGWIDAIFSAVKNAANYIVMLLPPSPFRAIETSVVAPYLGGLNYVLPISEVLAVMQLWLVSIGIYYTYMMILRWIKAVE